MRDIEMLGRGSNSSHAVHWPLAVLSATLLASSTAAPSRAAELCSAGMAGVTTSCEAAYGLAQDLARRRSDRALAGDPTKDRLRRLDGKQDETLPFALSGDGDNVNFQTSLTQWGSALSAADLENLKQAQTVMGGDASLPRTAKPRAPKFYLGARPQPALQ